MVGLTGIIRTYYTQCMLRSEVYTFATPPDRFSRTLPRSRYLTKAQILFADNTISHASYASSYQRSSLPSEQEVYEATIARCQRVTRRMFALTRQEVRQGISSQQSRELRNLSFDPAIGVIFSLTREGRRLLFFE